MKGIDFSAGRIKGSVIKAAGYDFVCRYLSHSSWKNITKEELNDFKANNLKVVLVWETTETRIDSGTDGGYRDAEDAVAQMKSLGLMTSQPIYFAVDEEIGSTQYLKLNSYLRGVANRLTQRYTGVYGGLSTIKYAFDQGLVHYGWQTLAWSHHQWDARAQLRQTTNGTPKLAGVICDLNESVKDDFGQISY
jgi:hypothetical protein